jgi:two-component system, NtrC family, sensor kinase
VAYPDLALVLRKTDLSSLPQVAQARAAPEAASDRPEIATSLEGRQVLAAHAAIAPLDWHVFVETPLTEAFAPLYSNLLWNAGLLLLGLAIAVFASLMLARNLVGPIRALQEGATRIGRGDLKSRIDVRTGDELQSLAEHFNQMAGQLQESCAQSRRQGRGADAGAGISPPAPGRRDREHLRGLCFVRPGRPAGPVQQPLSRPALSRHG